MKIDQKKQIQFTIYISAILLTFREDKLPCSPSICVCYTEPCVLECFLIHVNKFIREYTYLCSHASQKDKLSCLSLS